MDSKSDGYWTDFYQAIKIRYGLFLFILILGCLIYLSGLRVDFGAQTKISVVLLLILVVIRTLPRFGFLHVLFVAISSFIVLRYFSWRINYTLVPEGFISYVGSLALFLAELYGGLMFFLSLFVNIRPIRRKFTPLPLDQTLWPTVDVIIPSYDESFDLVKITLAAARNIDYPVEKLKIYLLDDGGTNEKLTATDKVARQLSLIRSQDLKKYCAELNIIYLTRQQNISAKAGNLNHALQHISGELILVLDADHMPSVDILEKTVGGFIQNKKLCLVQTPHFFINPDPFEKNLSLFYSMPAESDMFYKTIQMGLDFWQASFFCGSAAVLRRTAIDEIGGFSGKTITEDSETTLKLHSKGWRSHYLFYPLISGLQPETFDSFMIQRMRWAQGMVQNFIFNNPLLMPNLTVSQRICYLSSMMFWFFPIARVIFLIAPGMYLFFGLKVYHANIDEFLNYTVPFLGVLLLTNHYLFRDVRWVFVSEIYETMQSLFSFRAVLSVLRNPSKPKFAVTPKMQMLHQDVISPLSQPFYWALGYTLLAISAAAWRYNNYPNEQSIILFTSFWAFYNLLLLLATLGTLHERQQRRVNPRVPVQIPANWLIKSTIKEYEKRLPVVINDLSMGGGNLMSKVELCSQQENEQTFIEVQHVINKTLICYPASIASNMKKNDDYIYGVKFQSDNINEYLHIVKLIHGDSERWMGIYNGTNGNPGLISTIFFMIKIAVYHGVSHIYVALRILFQQLKSPYA